MANKKFNENEFLALHDLVKELLNSDKRYRDSDALLVNRIQKDELEKLYPNFRELTIVDFFRIRLNSLISSEGSITRARRKVNEHFPETRGLSYKKRQSQQVDFIDAVRTIGKKSEEKKINDFNNYTSLVKSHVLNKDEPKEKYCEFCQGTGIYESFPCNACK